MDDIQKVLCVGTPPDLRHSRQRVLESAGYDTISMDPSVAINALRTSSFDVMIISATVPEQERHLVRNAAPKQMRIIQLGKFTPPLELLKLVQSQAAS